MRQDRLDIGFAGRAICEAHHHLGAFLGKCKHAHFFTARGQRQRHAVKRRHGGIWLAVLAKYFDVDRVARSEVVAHGRVSGSVSHPNHAGKARQVIAAGGFRKKAFYAALDCVVHLMAISKNTTCRCLSHRSFTANKTSSLRGFVMHA